MHFVFVGGFVISGKESYFSQSYIIQRIVDIGIDAFLVNLLG